MMVCRGRWKETRKLQTTKTKRGREEIMIRKEGKGR